MKFTTTSLLFIGLVVSNLNSSSTAKYLKGGGKKEHDTEEEDTASQSNMNNVQNESIMKNSELIRKVRLFFCDFSFSFISRMTSQRH